MATAAAVLALVLVRADDATAASSIRYGVQDDAWLEHGPGTLDSRLADLRALGVEVVRYTVRWDQVARRQPRRPRDPGDAAYDWSGTDRILQRLRRHGIAPVVTLFGTPGWANGRRAPNFAPSSGTAFADFVRAAATRYSWVKLWTIWNEPNQASWLRPTSARTYVRKLLNPAYAQIHAVVAEARVGGGVTAARGGSGGVAPVAWIRAMGALRARVDAYAHHPYPGHPRTETPWGPACPHCSTLTMADLERLRAEVRRSLGPKRIWLTEYGYQTNPPDLLLGVPPATQAQHLASASRRAYLAPDVDLLVFFLVRDDTASDGWQSGLYTASGARKPAYTAFRLPFTQASRRGATVAVWGQIRPRSGRQPYRLRRYERGRWSWVGGTRWTDERRFFSVSVRAPVGALLQIWSPRDGSSSLALRVT
ncbi:MAG TPA: hypothetical protein VMN35_08720 [Gaiellaceae bacterium]|nr:hypothetical protein [Gaiellaceae bacterium]